MKRIVLTGGPCAGKTTALVRVIEYFSNLGYKVFTLPEVPTMFTQAGMNYLTKNKDFFYEGEKATLEIQLALEDKFTKMAATIDGPTLLVCDRGALDISAYMDPVLWERLMEDLGTSTEELRQRYDAVLHLVSAADGAEQFYTTSNNAQRLEKADEEGLRIARMLDKKVLGAWASHSHLRVMDNHSDFDTKMELVLREITRVLELPQPIKEERKFIVRVNGELPECITSDITQTYLTAEPDCEVRLRRRSTDGQTVFIYTSKKRTTENEEIVTERQVNNNIYESLLQQKDPYRQTIVKQRKSFIWQGNFYEIDTFLSPINDLAILELKGFEDDDELTFPPCIEVVKDITGDTNYYNYTIALRAK